MASVAVNGRRLAVAAVAMVAALAAASPAEAQFLDRDSPIFRGVTGQNRDVRFLADVGGRVGDLTIDWDARCRNGTRFAPQTTVFDAPPEGAGREVVEGVGRYRIAERGGRIARVTVVIAGRRSGPAGDFVAQSWTGTLRVRAEMRRYGRLTDRCTLRTRWRARAEGFGAGTWDMVPDTPPEGSPGPWRHEPATATTAAAGTRDAVSVVSQSAEGGRWYGSFRAPALNRLEPGRTYMPSRDVEGAASMSVTTTVPNECELEQSFTIERIAFDRLKRLASLRVSFVQSCGEGRSRWRGVIDWTAAR